MTVPSDRGALRVGFVMEQVLGHVSHYQTIRQVLERESGLEADWVEVTYRGQGLIERLRPLPGSMRGTARGFAQVRQGLRGRYDALLFHTQKPAVFQWDWLARVPTVLSLDVTPIQYDQMGAFYDHTPDGDNLVSALKHWINRRTFSLARGVVAWSHWVEHSLVADYGLPESHVRVIPPGVDLSVWNRSDSITLSPNGALPRVLFVGGDFERKGGQIVLDWFRVHGRGRCELDLVTRAKVDPEPGVRVHRGIVGNSDEARRLFFGADVFVLPSLAECFGIASVEAMAASVPVITTRVGGSEDIVVDGETGFLVAPGDASELATALDRLLSNPFLRSDMGARGRARAERLFDGRTNARALLEYLAQCAGLRVPQLDHLSNQPEMPRPHR